MTMIDQRPRFTLGEKFVPLLQPTKPALRRKVRVRDPEGRVRRTSFMREGPKPRGLQTIDEIQSLRTKQQGIKVRFGDSKSGKIKVKKRDAQGNIVRDDQGNPIIEEREFNFSLLAELLEGGTTDNLEKLAILENLLQAGATQSAQDINNLTMILATIFIGVQGIDKLSNENQALLVRALEFIGIGADPVAAGVPALIDGRFIDQTGWDADDGGNKALIQMFLLANFRENPRLSRGRPLIGLSGLPIKMDSANITMRGTAAAPFPVVDLVGKRIFRSLREARARTGAGPVRGPAGIAPGEVKIEEIPTGDRPFAGTFPVGAEGESPLERIIRGQSAEQQLEAATQARALVPFGAQTTQQISPELQQAFAAGEVTGDAAQMEEVLRQFREQ